MSKASKSKGKSHSDDLGTDGRTILEWILNKRVEKVWFGFIWLRIGTSGGVS
jgi:hypothetical protein